MSSGVRPAVSPKSYSNTPWVREGQASGSTARMVQSMRPASFSRRNGKARPPKLLRWEGVEGVRPRSNAKGGNSKHTIASGCRSDQKRRSAGRTRHAHMPTVTPHSGPPAAAGAADQQVWLLPHHGQLLQRLLANHRLVQQHLRAGGEGGRDVPACWRHSAWPAALGNRMNRGARRQRAALVAAEEGVVQVCGQIAVASAGAQCRCSSHQLTWFSTEPSAYLAAGSCAATSTASLQGGGMAGSSWLRGECARSASVVQEAQIA